MKLRFRNVAGTLMLACLALGGCGNQPAAPAIDAQGTEVARQVAIARAVDATLTAAAPASVFTPDAATLAPPPEPSSTVAVAPSATQAPTAAAVQPTVTPTQAIAAPTATRELVVVLPVDGDDGNADLRGGFSQNQGRNVVLPGFKADEIGDSMVFTDRLVFRVEVFDASDGQFHPDGRGIRQVDFTITDEDGEVVHERTEYNVRYCVFGGGEPACTVWVFAEHGGRWPGGTVIRNGAYLASMRIVPLDGEVANWRWRFEIERP